jgi:hypothetical protein
VQQFVGKNFFKFSSIKQLPEVLQQRTSSSVVLPEEEEDDLASTTGKCFAMDGSHSGGSRSMSGSRDGSFLSKITKKIYLK